MNAFRRVSIASVLTLALSVAVAPSPLAAQLASVAPVAARITQRIDNGQRTALAGHVRPFLNRATDEGAVDGSTATMPLMLMFSRTAAQQVDLDMLADALHNRNSAQFRRWLTPVQFGARFSPADSDVAQVRTWLESQGFKVLDVPPSKTFVSFTGTVGQLKSAFGVDIHKFSLDGEQHAATINEPQIPTALAPVVGGIRGLDNFGPKPMMTKPVLYRKDAKTGKVIPVAGAGPAQPRANFTDSAGGYQVAPQDFYTIYNENPLLQAGITGAGQTIAVIEEALINPADVASFRSIFGLAAYPATPNATAGGLNMLSGSSTGLNGYASCFSPASLTAGKKSGEEGEADLDAQWAGTVAPNAIVDFVACGGTSKSADGTTLGSLGIDHAAQYVVNYLQGSVVAASMSYGECEADMSSSATSGVGYYNNQWQQFAVEGITAVVSSGDGGATQCYQNAAEATTLPPSVNGFGSSAWNVSAGGTDFGDNYETNDYTTSPATTWWNATNSASLGSAVSYVPETSWGGYCSNPLFASTLQKQSSTSFGTVYNPIAICNSTYDNSAYRQIVGGAGGISVYNSIPSWQGVYGIGANSVSSTNRNLPDVSLFAANGFWGHLLPLCESDEAACTESNYAAENENLGAGGTSYVAPQLAGFFALVAQQTGESQGQADYTLYNLAAQQYGAKGSASSSLASCSGSGLAPGSLPPTSCIFHDISNDMPSLQGGTITAGNYQPCTVASSSYCDGTIGTTSYTYGVSVVPGSTAASGVLAYTVSPGYDDVTGLGSFNINNLVTEWNTVSPGFASVTTLAASTNSIAQSTTVLLTSTVQATGRGNAAPAGAVTFYLNGSTSLGTAALTSSCTGTGASTACIGTATFTLTAAALNPGSNSITAYFPGDAANDAPSTSTAVTITSTAPVTASKLVYSAVPATPITAGGNAGIVSMSLENSSNNVATTNSSTVVSLAVTGTGGYSQTYTSTASSGVATFDLSSVPLTAAGTYTYTATAASLTQAQVTELVTAGTAAGFTLTGLSTFTAPQMTGMAAITAVDAFGNAATGFTGTVTLTSTDAIATFSPGSYTYTASDEGSHIFSVTLNTAGTQTVTATSGSATGSETGILVEDSILILNSNSTLARATDAGVQTTAFGSASSSSSPYGGLGFDHAGDIWAVTSASNVVQEFTRSGTAVAVSGSAGAGVNAPVSLFIDGSGQVWVANTNNSISVLSNAREAVSPGTGYQPGSLNAPSAIVGDGAGAVWITSRTGNSVTKVFGAAAPVVTPAATGAANNTLGTRP